MPKKNTDVITISKDTWDTLKNNPIYIELLEDIEDREDLLKEKAKNEKGKSFHELIGQEKKDI